MTDYNLPPNWEFMTPAQRNAWFVAERVRRQAENQHIDQRERSLDHE